VSFGLVRALPCIPREVGLEVGIGILVPIEYDKEKLYMRSFPNMILVLSCTVVHTVLDHGPHVRVVLVTSPIYGYGPP
jgi:hypothetical protein